MNGGAEGREGDRGVLAELGALVDALETLFFCAGQSAPESPVALRWAEGAVVSFGPRGPSAAAVARLLALLAPAPFGQGAATRLDPSVRRGLHRKAEGGAFEVTGFDPLGSGVLEAVRAQLLPHEAGPLGAALDAVHVYEPGGHFARHRDAPKGDGVVATLVVCLPSPFEGGELVLHGGARAARIDFASAHARAPRALPWAAFFGDVEHEVAPVRAGRRITLAYRIYVGGPGARRGGGAAGAEAGGETPRGRPERAAGEALRRRLERAAGDPTFLPLGGVLRVPCAHLYRAGPATPARRALAPDAEHGLKGRDALVARAAAGAGLRVTFAAWLAASEYDDVAGATDDEIAAIWRLPALPGRSAAARLARRAERGDFDEPEPVDDVHVVGRADAVLRLFRGLYSPTGYYGNEASEYEFYALGALDVEVPPARERVPDGRRVVHPKFGPGVVLTASGGGADETFRVRFDDGAERTMLARFLAPA